MTQRKLTDEQVQFVEDARVAIVSMCDWDDTTKGYNFWFDVVIQLNDMQENKTADGQPYVEPGPPIPDGWREWAIGDEGRVDAKFWSPMASEWQDRPYPRLGFTSNDQYIVPVDKVPTDDDAKSRPEVMVLDCQTELWGPARLLAVIADSPARLPFIAQLPGGWVREYRDCRFPYPGERVDGRSLRLGE